MGIIWIDGYLLVNDKRRGITMISRLDRLQGRDIYENTALAKINELVDAVNKLQEEAENNARIRADHEHKIEEFQAKDEEIAEWIDILEAVRKSVNVHEKQIDELQMKLEPEKCDIPDSDDAIQEVIHSDPYAEQRKWIGTLCEFWDYDGEEKWFSILEHIDKNSPYQYCASGDWWYKHCEPVKPDDDIIYKGGDNE